MRILSSNSRPFLSVFSLFAKIDTRHFSTIDMASMQSSRLLLPCQQDSYVRVSHNKVLICESIPERNSRYKLLLQDSILYPEGGGQPCDLGTVDQYLVCKVSKPDSSFVPSELRDFPNLVEVEIEGGPIEVGQEVKCVVDWDRRYEFMQQHSAQHLFSAIADEKYGAQTMGWSMGVDAATVDLACEPPLNWNDIQNIEDEVNLNIREGRKISWKIFSRCDLENPASNPELRHLRGEVKGAALQMDDLRLVTIAGVDTNPCGGTHLNSLSELNVLKVLGIEKDRGCVRVRFVAGSRALNYFRNCIERESTLSSKLSVPPSDLIAVVDKLLKDKKDTTKRYDVYSEELAWLWGKSLAESEYGKMKLIVVHRPGADLKFLVKAASAVLEAIPDCLILLAGDENMPQSIGSKPVKLDSRKGLSGPIVLFGEQSVVGRVKDKVLEILGARGGGRPGKLQAQATFLNKLDEVHVYLKEDLSSSR